MLLMTPCSTPNLASAMYRPSYRLSNGVYVSCQVHLPSFLALDIRVAAPQLRIRSAGLELNHTAPHR